MGKKGWNEGNQGGNERNAGNGDWNTGGVGEGIKVEMTGMQGIMVGNVRKRGGKVGIQSRIVGNRGKNVGVAAEMLSGVESGKNHSKYFCL